LWLKEGDNNTKFFHNSANAHKRSNHFDQLEVEGKIITEPDRVKEEIIQFYEKLYSETERWRPDGNLAYCPSISEKERSQLQAKFEKQEVYKCLKLCAIDKAPGPDGYTMGFFIKCWEILKHDVMAAFHNFYEQEMFEKSFNATYIALIPKKKGAKELKDFRPISLIGSFYKLLSKVLTERIKRLMYKLVDSQQMAFIKGRQIMDAVLIANEAIDSRVGQKKPGILCKLDIEKAYDHVNWGFLLNILRKMGFGEKWIRWIHFCISTVKFSVLINGAPEGFFEAQRGIRQGDPVSPFLFILAMEGLNNMIKTAKTNRWITGFEVSTNNERSLEVTHLQYADDTLIFCDADEEQLRYLRVILVLFEGMSGLHINWGKSHLYPINLVSNMELLASVIGGEVGALPAIYLGMPLGAKSQSKEIWNTVLEKCEKKLVRWKAQYLSKGGRLTLINAVLDALPTYMLTLFPIPAGVVQRLDKLRRDFFLARKQEKKGIPSGKMESYDHGKKTRRIRHQKFEEPKQGSKAEMVVEICS